MPAAEQRPEGWTSQDKFATVLETAIQRMLDKHRSDDTLPQRDRQREREEKQIATLRRHIDKLKAFQRAQ